MAQVYTKPSNIQLRPEDLKMVDAFQKKQKLPTRTQAARMLMELGNEYHNYQQKALKKLLPNIS
jgi:hypothetical protein